MFTRLSLLWSSARDSLWLIPSLLTGASVFLAVALVRFESWLDGEVPLSEFGLFFGSVAGARAVLSTIAGSLITVTGVIFSVTIVALQLASSQFSPRILRNFTADRTNQWVLGIFIGTFTYTLLVLRVVRSTDEGEVFVPQIAVSLAIVLTLISIASLIRFIHHAARSVQASVILERISSVALGQIQRLFPDDLGDAAVEYDVNALRVGTARPVTATTHGYLQAVDGNALFELAVKRQIFVEMTKPIGAFLIQGETAAEIWSVEEVADETTAQIAQAFVLGDERTPDQDIEFFLLEISDIAVKSLSPGINDPTTAKHCIDRLGQLLAALGNRRPPEPHRTEHEKIHFLERPTRFDRALEVAFADVIHYGRDNPGIVARLRAVLETLANLLTQERAATLRTFIRVNLPAED